MRPDGRRRFATLSTAARRPKGGLYARQLTASRKAADWRAARHGAAVKGRPRRPGQGGRSGRRMSRKITLGREVQTGRRPTAGSRLCLFCCAAAAANGSLNFKDKGKQIGAKEYGCRPEPADRPQEVICPFCRTCGDAASLKVRQFLGLDRKLGCYA